MPRISTASLAPLPSTPDQPGGTATTDVPPELLEGGSNAGLEPSLPGPPAAEQEPVRRRRRRNVAEIQLPGTSPSPAPLVTPPEPVRIELLPVELEALGKLVVLARVAGQPLEAYAAAICRQADVWRKLQG